jgi:4'-phosphopantetheinyl transferase, cesP
VIEEVDKIPKEEIIISTDKYGKPFVSESSICFNVSHSGEFAVIIFDSTSVGVDIEIMKDLDFETILKEFATEFEMQQFYKSSSHQKFFYQLWTLKESYFKCKGTGITNLKEIEFFISDAVIISNKLGYTFETNIFFDNYMVSYCKKS